MEESDLYNFYKQTFKSRLFLGEYTERRLFDKINDYRSVVTINNTEKELLHDLANFERKLLKNVSNSWRGFSCDNHEIYSNELDETPFGCFWFQIRRFIIRSNESVFELRPIRKVDDESSQISIGANSESDRSSHIEQSIEWKEIAESYRDASVNGIKEFLYYKVNGESIIAFLKFVGLLLVGTSLGLLHLLKCIGDFTLRLIFEVTRFLKVCTPLFLGFIDFLSKIVGGFYILLAMLWKDSIGQGTPPPQLALAYKKPYESVYKRNPVRYTR